MDLLRITCLIAALLLCPPAFADAAEDAEVFALAQQLKPLRAVDVVDLVQEKRLGGESKKPVMLFIYASWCPHCRASMEILDNLVKDGGLKGVEPIFLSVDNDFLALSSYLLTKKSAYFTPYVLKSTGLAPPIEIFRASLGLQFNGGIPYFAFIDADGHLAHEASGEIPGEMLTGYLRDLK